MPQEHQTPTESPSGCSGGSCYRGSGKWIWLLLAAAIIAIVVAKNVKQLEAPPAMKASTATKADTAPSGQAAMASVAQGQTQPRLVDLGATKCIPCKMMAPILEDLKKTYAGQLTVDFIDVWEKPDVAKQFKINVIPTQIFFTRDGKELFRHEGFYAKEDILAKWREFGILLNSPPTNASKKGQDS